MSSSAPGADEHQVGVGISDAEHDLTAPERVQLAAAAVADFSAHAGERLGGGGKDKGHGRGVLARPAAPEGILADARHAELSREFEMLPERFAIH